MPNFTVFKGRSMPVSRQPAVTIQKTGTFTLNHAAVEALGQPQFVELLYDAAAQIVGFRPAKGGLRHMYRIYKQLDSRTYLVSAEAFLKHNDIPYEITRRYPGYMDGRNLCINLRGDQLPAKQPKRPAHGRTAEE